MEILTIFFIGISLSLDAFSLSIAYGLLNIERKQTITISLLVGIFHFFMTFCGNFIGSLITKYVYINPKYILITIFIFIIIEMIKSMKEETVDEYKLTLANMLLFPFLVSIDSFTVGIGLSVITTKIFLSCLIFAFLSCIFTYLGFLLGKIISKRIKTISKLVGILIMFTLIIYFCCKP